jgi:hypothetical protein
MEEEFLIEKRKELIDAFHKEIWIGVRDQHKIVIQNIIVIAWIGFLIKFGLENVEYFCFTIIIAQVILGWVILIVLEAAYWYRVVQIVSSNIEKVFGCSSVLIDGKEKKIIPPSWNDPKIDLPNTYRIHCYFLCIIFLFLTILSVVKILSDKILILNYFYSIIIIAFGVCGMCLFYCYWNCCRKKRLINLKKDLLSQNE